MPLKHAIRGLITQANFLDIYFYMQRREIQGIVSALTHLTAVKWMRFSLIIFVFMQAHTCYSLFWSCFIFSTVATSVGGFLVGMFICTLSFEVDFLVNLVFAFYEKSILKFLACDSH